MAARVESGHNRIFARGKDTTMDLSIYRQWLLQNENKDEKGMVGERDGVRERMRDELY